MSLYLNKPGQQLKDIVSFKIVANKDFCCVTVKEDTQDDLPNIPPPKQRKRKKPKGEADKASKLGSGIGLYE